jgi:hypothetical protein
VGDLRRDVALVGEQAVYPGLQEHHHLRIDGATVCRGVRPSPVLTGRNVFSARKV